MKTSMIIAVLEGMRFDLEKQIDTYKRQAGIDSLLLQHKDFQIGILNERSKLYEEQVKLVRPKWYESKYRFT